MNTTLKCVISGDQKIMWMEYNVDLIKKFPMEIKMDGKMITLIGLHSSRSSAVKHHT